MDKERPSVQVAGPFWGFPVEAILASTDVSITEQSSVTINSSVQQLVESPDSRRTITNEMGCCCWTTWLRSISSGSFPAAAANKEEVDDEEDDVDLDWIAFSTCSACCCCCGCSVCCCSFLRVGVMGRTSSLTC